MKRGDAKSLTQIPCPLCKLGKAVNRKSAHKVFTSKKYIKLRKARRQANPKSLPTIGKNTNLEAALLNPELAEFFNPAPKPRKVNPIDFLLDHVLLRTILGILLGVSSIWFVDWLWEQGWPEDTARFFAKMLFLAVMAGLWIIWYRLDIVVEKLESEEIKLWLQEDRITWVCLRCRQPFLWEASQTTSRKNKR